MKNCVACTKFTGSQIFLGKPYFVENRIKLGHQSRSLTTVNILNGTFL